jgi:hypothetical protein
LGNWLENCVQQALHAEFRRQIDHEPLQGRMEIWREHALLEVLAVPVAIFSADEQAIGSVAKEQAVCVHVDGEQFGVLGVMGPQSRQSPS